MREMQMEENQMVTKHETFSSLKGHQSRQNQRRSQTIRPNQCVGFLHSSRLPLATVLRWSDNLWTDVRAELTV